MAGLAVGCALPEAEYEERAPIAVDGPRLDAGEVVPSDVGVTPEPGPQSVPLAIQPAVLPRLTAAQYINTVEDIFGESLPQILLESDTNPDLFYSIGATSTDVTERAIALYAAAAYQLSAYALAPERRLSTVGCEVVELSDGCVTQFIYRMGRRLFRRPLTEDEVGKWRQLAEDTADGEPYKGLEYTLAGLLQSPYFL